MKPDNDQPKVTLEQLLRVKRAEKPAPEFWAQFERELRVKQLAAIVEPRPWWAPFIRVGSRLARYQIPVGAAAVVALTLLTVRQYDTENPSSSRSLVPQVLSEQAEKRGLALASSADVAEKGEDARSLNPNAAGSLAATMSRAHRATSVSSHALGAGAMLGGSGTGFREESSDELDSHSVAARMVAANLEVVKTSEPELVPLLELALASQQAQAGQVAAVAVRDPLSQVGAEAAQRRSSRLLGSALPATATVVASAASSSSLRLNRSISEERIYDSMRRGRLNAERVPIKF